MTELREKNERLRAALNEIAATASRNGPPDHVQALNIIADRARTVLHETR